MTGIAGPVEGEPQQEGEKMDSKQVKEAEAISEQDARSGEVDGLNEAENTQSSMNGINERGPSDVQLPDGDIKADENVKDSSKDKNIINDLCKGKKMATDIEESRHDNNSDTSPNTEGSLPKLENNTNSDGRDLVKSGTIENGCLSKKKVENAGGDLTKDSENKSNEQEIVLIQDTGFTIKISVPGLEPFDLPVSSMELVQEIHQVLMDREDSCHRTCFSLQLDGTTLDNFAELKTIEGLKDGSFVKVVEEPYTVREARIHVRHIRDLLKSMDQADAYIGIDCMSLSFLNAVTGDVIDRKKTKSDFVDCTPPDYIMPGSSDRPISPLHPTFKDQKGPICLKVLTYSGWNPPPGNRRMHGDLLYLYIVTLEDKKFHATASSRGFYLNHSTEEEFNPKAAPQKHLSHSLIDFLNQISPSFKKNFSNFLKRRAQKHPFERVPTPYQVYSWIAPQFDHTVDFIRAEDAFSTRLGYEEHIPGQTRDWNEEIQTTRELPRKTLPDRLIRERAIFKVNSDFVAAATRGAMAVVDGNVMAINPGEDAKMQMFIWNNIFFSLGFDVRDHYKDFGGDFAAYAAPGSDLQGVKSYSGVDVENLYMLGTVVIDYRGYRVTGQSIIPGILERDQEQSVVYGSVDFGKTVLSNDKYKELLQKTASQLKIRPHKVINSKKEEVELYSSVECKGIIGNDQRHYVLDLLRTFPPDPNFLPAKTVELSKEMQNLGFPRKHRHKLACLRQELIEAFTEHRYLSFIRNAACQFQQIRLKNQLRVDPGIGKSAEKTGTCLLEKTDEVEEIATDEAKKIVDALTGTDSQTLAENGKEIMRKAARSVGSLSDTEFNITFNPDVFQPHVQHPNSEGEQFKKEKQLVKDATEFLVLHQVPSLLNECLDHTASLIDGSSLTEAMHHRGINMRYLGYVAEMFSKHPQISYLHSIAVIELVSRAAKHLFKSYMQGIPMMNLTSAITHFLNCYLGSFSTPHAQIGTEETQKTLRRRNKRKNKSGVLLIPDNTEWVSESPRSLWKKIVEEVYSYYYYKVESDSVDSTVDRYGLQKVSLLRSFCQKCGVQIFLREYNLDNRHKQAFYEEDIINVFPIVKNTNPKASDAYHFFTSGQNKIQQGLLHEGYELISEALNLLNNVYGAMHPDIVACLRLLARLNYIMEDYVEALSYQQRAVLMSERVLGIDHPNTITEYAHLALYCFANNQVSNSLRLMYRARYLALLCHGENHPEVALFDSNIGLILHAAEEFDLSLRFLEKALQLNIKFFGAKSLKVAMSYHLVARTLSCRSDFRTALQSEKEAYAVYRQILGEDHERTKESTECLKHLTQQAVVFQKKMNEICKGEKGITFAPLQIQTPSLQSVLDTLNVINGILFVQIRPEDIERYRQEITRRQQEQSDKSRGEQAKDALKEFSAKFTPGGLQSINGDILF